MQERQSQSQQQQLQSDQQIAQMEMELRQAEINQKEQANIRDNETKILIATIGSVEEDGIEEVDSSKTRKADIVRSAYESAKSKKKQKEVSNDKFQAHDPRCPP